MYNDRVLRGNTYAILKDANRNIDTNIKPPQQKKIKSIFIEVNKINFIILQKVNIIQHNKDIPSPKAVNGR